MLEMLQVGSRVTAVQNHARNNTQQLGGSNTANTSGMVGGET